MTTRYPGSRPFADDPLERILFCGRKEEKRALLHAILAEDLVLLYGKSGIGKTSLVNAGVMEELRKEGCWPLLLRLNKPGPDPTAALRRQIEGQGGEMEFRLGVGSGHLVRLFDALEIWRGNRLLTPVLVFDQFEELFTLWKQGDRKQFIEQFADLARRRAPRSDEDSDSRRHAGRPRRVKIVVSLREDYLGEMEEVAAELPEVLHKRFRLTALTREQATQAIRVPARFEHKDLETPRFFYYDSAIDAMLTYLCRRFERRGVRPTNEVEPFQLQLLCQHLECEAMRKRDDGLKQITFRAEDLGGDEGMRQILQDFYRSVIDRFRTKRERDALRRLCEEGLIGRHGKRLPLSAEQIRDEYRIGATNLGRLVSMRLLQCEDRLGQTFYELSHDTLVEPILYERNERSPDALFERAEKHRLKREFDKAIRVYKRVTGLDPGYARAYEQWGEVQMSQGQMREAAGVFLKALDRGVETATLHHRLGKVHAEQGDYETAIEHYEKALARDSRLAVVQLDLGDALRSRGQRQEALEAYHEAVRAGSRNANIHREVALRLIQNGHFEEAVKLFQEAVHADAEFAYIFEDLANGLRIREQDEIARTLCRLALGVESKNAGYYNRVGKELAAVEDYEGARLAWQKSLDLDRGRPATRDSLGVALARLGHHRKAIKSFRETIRLEHEFTDAHFHLGLSLAAIGRHEEAIKSFRETYRQDEVYLGALLAWGKSLKKLGRQREAKRKFQEALEIEPDLTDTYPELAKLVAARLT